MKPRRRADLPCRELPDGECMLLTPDADQAIVLNAVATAVWHLADGSHTLAQIARFVADHFEDVPCDRVEGDVAALVEQLLDQGVLEL